MPDSPEKSRWDGKRAMDQHLQDWLERVETNMNEGFGKMHERLDKTTQYFGEKHTEVVQRVTAVEVKSGVWGALSGAISGAVIGIGAWFAGKH